MNNLQSIAHHRQPNRMLQPIVIMGKRTTCIIRRVDKHTFYLPRKLRFQRLQRQQIVPKNQLQEISLQAIWSILPTSG